MIRMHNQQKINRKGEVDIEKIFVLIGYTILSSILIIFLLFFFNQFRSNYTQIPQGLEDQITVHYLMTTPECFLYQDPYTNTNHLLVYDSQKLSQEQIEHCAKSKEYQFRLRFSGDFPEYGIYTGSFNPAKFAEAIELYPDLSYLVYRQNNFHKAQVHLEVQT